MDPSPQQSNLTVVSSEPLPEDLHVVDSQPLPTHIHLDTAHSMKGPAWEPGTAGRILTAPYQSIGQGTSDIYNAQSPSDVGTGALKVGLGGLGVIAPTMLPQMVMNPTLATLSSLGLGYGGSRLAREMGASEPVADAVGVLTGGLTGKLMPGLKGGMPDSFTRLLDILPWRPGSRINEFLAPSKVAATPTPRTPGAPKAPKPTIPPVKYTGRFNEPETPAPVIPPVQYTGRFNQPEAPAPTIPPVQYTGRFNEPPSVNITPTIPPVRPGRSFAPPEAAPTLAAPIPPVSYTGRFNQPTPTPSTIPPLQFNNRFAQPPVEPGVPPAVTYPGRFREPPTQPPSGTPTPAAPPAVPQAPQGLMPNLPPMSYTESMRQLHATLQQMELPGAPAGTKVPSGTVTDIAKNVFGKGGAPDLTPDEVQSITNFVVKNKRLPIKGEKLQ